MRKIVCRLRLNEVSRQWRRRPKLPPNASCSCISCSPTGCPPRGGVGRRPASGRNFCQGTSPPRVACGGCRATGRCVRGGLVNDAIDAMETADALVLASPVHYAGISGAMSAFCDRLFYASDGWANKPCACVVSARRAGTTAALDQLVKYPMISNMPVVSSQYWPMVHGACPEDAAQDAEGLQTMRQLARNLLWLVRCIAAGDTAGVARPETEARTFTNFIR